MAGAFGDRSNSTRSPLSLPLLFEERAMRDGCMRSWGWKSLQAGLHSNLKSVTIAPPPAFLPLCGLGAGFMARAWRLANR
eukprot:350232-Chlamydomonas_euryale.AAC.8